MQHAGRVIRKLRQGKHTPANSAKLESFLREVDRRLRTYGDDRHGNPHDPLDDLVFIILSAQTESYLYRETYRDLRAAYTPWERLLGGTEAEISAVIRRGGLGRKKAGQLKAAFAKIVADNGRLSLRFLQRSADADALRYLTSLPGIGIKSAKCVMMYALDRKVLPVDTHVWRVARRLGLAPHVPKPTDAQERALEQKVPRDIRQRLHVNLVSHGQQTCRTYFPKCDQCALSDLCRSRGKTDTVWNAWRRPRGVWATESASIKSRAAHQSKDS